MAMDKKKGSADSKKVLQTPKTAEEKQKALQTAIEHIEKTYGAGAVMKLGQTTTYKVSYNFV